MEYRCIPNYISLVCRCVCVYLYIFMCQNRQHIRRLDQFHREWTTDDGRNYGSVHTFSHLCYMCRLSSIIIFRMQYYVVPCVVHS